MSEHKCTIVMDRYPTCSCGSGTWPCRVKEEEEAREVQHREDDRIARAVVDEIERRAALHPQEGNDE